MSHGVGRAGIYHKGVGLDTHHKGTGQAGNKSLLSYKVDTGVAGYTGFIPGGAGVGIPTKGSTLHTGKCAGEDNIQRFAGQHNVISKVSEYHDTYKAESKDYYPTKTEGGQWQAPRNGEVVTNARFHYGTTYQHETQRSPDTARKAHSLTEGLRPTLSNEIQAHNRVLSGRLNTQPSKELGYTSQYMSMVVKDPLIGGNHAAGRTPPEVPLRPPPQREREKVIQRTLNPEFDGSSMYMKHYGVAGSDPLASSARHESDMSRMASTRELFKGTAKGTDNMMGYSGFVPLAPHNLAANAAASLGHGGRDSAKDNMLLSSMDQFSRNTLPRYGGYRTQAVVNAHGSCPQVTDGTHQGRMNTEVWTSADRAAPNKKNNLTSKDGTLSFFTGGAGTVSDNGKHLAQCYYLAVRPKEGLPRIHYPSKTTVWGSTFK
mmetsp:Transcript_32627/g.45277  ORF Transcript_32627/g.45277 Transcript_32627/m.45277 type:complete len:430 (-) Transcript_32627:58-1347(-)|eukprot:CAMPEP_0196587748 /NCGR_PEP_ID=MMETSP1081-20130531/58493_1 /TAXON_ID=36882 /ORGANISM="Pyramimonas amylifera, Strain CCMP720" /LENGTH=429 /DNA_ID=CAMNT_0041910023 /DNA_START=114 /DNA_END=1403 /DNA_ORIENTATION=+